MTAKGRAALLAETWGPEPRRRRLQEILRAGRNGSGFGGAFDLLNCGWDGVPDLHGIVVALFVVVAAASLFMLVAAVIGRVRDARSRRRRLRPFGASDLRAVRHFERPQTGVVEGASQPSPLRGEPCVAHRIDLRASAAAGAGTLLWQEAATRGFDVRLDDGDVVRIPPGRVRMANEEGGGYVRDRAGAAERLPADLGVDVPGELPLVPFDQAFEEVIRVGDRIAVLGSLERRQEIGGAPAGSRTPAATVLVPLAVPVLART